MMKSTLAVAILGLLSACSGGAPLPAKAGANTLAGGVRKADLVKYVGKVMPSRSPVSALEIDELGMRIDAFRVGLVEFMQSQTPQVEFVIPEQADYVELLRCREDAVAIRSLLNVEMSVANAVAVVRNMRETDFWKDASTSQSCLLISPSVSQNGYFDASAPTGTWRYVARACVQQERLIDKEIMGTRNCSRMVGVSTSLRDFKNARAERENKSVDDMRTALAKADGIGRQIFFQTIEFNNSIALCEKNKASNDKAEKHFSAIAQIIGAGVSLGATLLTASPQGSSIESLWNNRNVILGRGNEIGGVLSGLFINPSDYSNSCTSAEKIRDQIRLNAVELKLAHQEYLAARVVASDAISARGALEKTP